MEATKISPLSTLLRAFPGIPLTEARELIAGGHLSTYPSGTILCLEDAFESTFYIMMDGEVKVTKALSYDQERELTTLHNGDFFGEMALLQDAPRAATVTTTEPTTVLEIRKDLFDQLVDNSVSLSRAMVQQVVRRLRENDAMTIEDLRLKAGELAAAYQQLAEQEYSRREFLTMIAHELRTPLTAASGFLGMIESGMLSGRNLDSDLQQAALKSASRNLQQIVSLVNDILFIQEMDLILPHFAQVDLGKLLEDEIDTLKEKAAENQVEILLQVEEGLPSRSTETFLAGDAKSLERAFGAILDNAIKFSDPGGVVRVYLCQVDQALQVEISDQGVGIPPEVLPRIFERFFHVDQIDGRMFRGAGLGLSIARQVIEQHHGRILVASELQQGTIVTVIFDPTVQQNP
jgi:signal transduction histidine kinase